MVSKHVFLPLISLLLVAHLGAGTFYLSPDGDDEQPGTREEPWRTLEHAGSMARAGDTVILLPGDYPGQLVVRHSGRPEAPIEFRAEHRRTARLTGRPITQHRMDNRSWPEGNDFYVVLQEVSHVRLEGLHIQPGVEVQDPDEYQNLWLYIKNSDNVEIVDCLMEGAPVQINSRHPREQGRSFYWYGSVSVRDSSHIAFRDNVIRRKNIGDMIQISRVRHFLFEGNAVSRGGHVPFRLGGGGLEDGSVRHVVLRGNVFHGEWCRNFEFAAPRDVLMEHNAILHSYNGGNSASSRSNFTLNRGIFRFNRIYRNWGHPGLGTGSLGRPDNREELQTESFKAYNNVFDGNQEGGVYIPSGHLFARNTVYKNNIFSNNPAEGEDVLLEWFEHHLEPPTHFIRNVLFSGTPGAATVHYLCKREAWDIGYVRGGWEAQASGARRTAFENEGNSFYMNPDVLEDIRRMRNRFESLEALETLAPDRFVDNLDIPPGYQDAENFNHALASDSPLRNAGRFLTEATEGGSGRTLRVKDASYFYDGFGFANEYGDWIAIGHNGAQARVEAVDLELNLLFLDRVISCEEGDPVSLPWSGTAPDIGVYEHGSAARSTVQIVTEPFLSRPGEPVRLSAVVRGIEEPVSYQWRLGDGTLATESSLTHVYSESDHYPVRLRVTDAGGRDHVAAALVAVRQEKEPDEPLLHFTFDPDDHDVWWRWQTYRPSWPPGGRPQVQQVDPDTGRGMLVVGAPGDGSPLTARIHPEHWDIDRHPLIRLRYRVVPGTPIGIYALRLGRWEHLYANDTAARRVYLAGSPTANPDQIEAVGETVLHDDGEWHEVTLDARLIRSRYPDAHILSGIVIEAVTGRAVKEGMGYAIDTFGIWPE